MSNLEPDLESARQFLAWIDPTPDAVFGFQTYDDDKVRGDPRLARPSPLGPPLTLDDLVSLNQAGAAVCFALNELATGAPRRAENVTRIRGLWVDLDAAPLFPLLALPLPPTIVTETSPGRRQCLWIIDPRDPLPVDRFDECQAALAALAHGDANVGRCGPQSAPRLVGFYHQKDVPHRVRVALMPPRRSSGYFARDLMRMLGVADERPAPAPSARRFDRDWSPVGDDLIANALAHIDPRRYRAYGGWLRIAMACHHATEGEGWHAFLDWSARDPAYGEAHRERNLVVWRGIGRREVAEPVTVATLVRELRNADTDAADDAADALLFHDVLDVPGMGDPPPPWLVEAMTADAAEETEHQTTIARTDWRPQEAEPVGQDWRST